MKKFEIAKIISAGILYYLAVMLTFSIPMVIVYWVLTKLVFFLF